MPALYNVAWEMEGLFVQADGMIKERIPMTISGTIHNGEDKDSLLLDITTPEDFRYMCSIPEPDGYVSFSRQNGKIPYYYFSSYCYDKLHDEPRFGTFAIDVEKGFFFADWNDGSGCYLVAATDPDVTAEEILAYFRKLDTTEQQS